MRRLETADLMLLVTVLIWGFNFTVTKYVLTEGFQPLAYASIRFSAGAVLFAAVTYQLEGSLAVRRRDIMLLLGAAAFGIWLNQVSYVYALTFTTAATTAIVFGTTPIFTIFFARLVGLERLSARFLLASLVSFAGVTLVAMGAGGGITGDVRGILLALAGAATWAGYSVAIAPLMRRYSPYRISAIVLLAGCVLLVASGAEQLLEQDYSFGSLVWAGLVFALLGPLVLTNILWFTAIDRVGPSHAALFANLMPFLAVTFALLVLSEAMTLLQVAGGVAIGFGIILARRRRAPVAAPAD